MINVRKLAAVDLHFLGPRIILAEFGLGVTIVLALGILSLRVGLFRTHAAWQIVLDIYLLLLAINYIPILWCAIDIARHGTAAAELGDELSDKGAAMRAIQSDDKIVVAGRVVTVALHGQFVTSLVVARYLK
jgi:hypothetical protein